MAERRREVRRQLMARKRAEDPDYDRNVRLKYRNKRLDWERQDRALNPEKYQERAAAWRRANPHPLALAKHKYRASLRENGSIPYTAEQWEQKVAMWGGNCWICRKPLNGIMHRDHVKPINKGGMDCLSNLRPSCGPCNIAKRDKWPFRPKEDLCPTTQ